MRSSDDTTPRANPSIPIVDVNDPVFTFLAGTAPPLARIASGDVDTAIAQLDKAASLAVTPDGSGRRWVPGLAIVVVGGEPGHEKVVYCKGHGTKSVAGTDPVNADTLFPCASLSKPVSTSLLVGVGAGTNPAWDAQALQADGTTSYRLHDSKDPQTLRQWLSHRSGLPDHAGDLIEDLNPAMGRHQIFDHIMQYQTGVTPWKYAYTNFGFSIGCFGALRSARDRVDWEAFADQEMHARGMTRSTYRFTSAFDDPDPNRVRPHVGQPAPPELLSQDPVGWKWRVVDRDEERDPSRQAPAGSLLSSAHDLGTFLITHLREGFGKDFPPRTPDPRELLRPSHWYSLGWNVANHSGEQVFKEFGNAVNALSFSHSGAFSLGAGTCLRFDRDAHYGIAVLSNGEPTGVPEALSQIFFKYLYATPMPPGCTHADVFALCRALYLGEMYKKKIENYQRYYGKATATPDSIPQGELFRGHSAYYGCDITIERRQRDLFLKMGTDAPGKPRGSFLLGCLDPATSTYVYATAGENAIGLSAVHLTWDGGALVRVEDDWLEDSGPGLGDIAHGVTRV